jgi:hypothetical protein
VEEIKQAFDHIDLNKNGGIDLKEMKHAIIELGLDGRNTLIKEIFRLLDGDLSREIDFNEFLVMMSNPMILGNDLTQFRQFFRAKIVSAFMGIVYPFSKFPALIQGINVKCEKIKKFFGRFNKQV